MKALPPRVLRLLEQQALAADGVLVLSFDAQWQVLELTGPADAYGLAETDRAALGERFREVCIGLSRVRGTYLPQVELPGGAVVDLYLVAEATLFHAVLVDVRGQVEQARGVQQAVQEARLEVAAKVRESVELRRQLARVRAEAEALKGIQALQQQHLHAVRAQLDGLQVALNHELDSVLRQSPEASPLRMGARRAWECAERLRLLSDSLRVLALPDAAEPNAAGSIATDSSASPGSGAALDLEAMLAPVVDAIGSLARQAGIGFLLRPKRRDSIGPSGWPAAQLRLLVHHALAQAVLRTPSGHVEADLSWDGQMLKLKVVHTAAAYDSAERACLWDGALPNPTRPAQGALYALGRCQRALGGRITLGDSTATDPELLLSLAQPAALGAEITQRLPQGGLVFLVSTDENLARRIGQRLADAGHEVEPALPGPALIDAARTRAPVAILLDAALEHTVRTAFQLKSQGYAGRIVVLGPLPDSPAARSSVDMRLSTDPDPQALQQALA